MEHWFEGNKMTVQVTSEEDLWGEPGMAAPKACSSSTEVSGPPSSCGRFSWHRALFKTSAFQTAALTLLSSRFSG